MAFIRISDQFSEDSRMEAAGPLAMAMYVAALCYCSRAKTHGFVPRGIAWRLLCLDGIVMVGDYEPASWRKLVDRLAEVELWREAAGGWRIVDWQRHEWPKEV
jgi:hypothetical protein